MKAIDLALELMGEVCCKAVGPEDYCILSTTSDGTGYITYSRYKQGPYVSAVAFHVVGDLLIVTPTVLRQKSADNIWVWKHLNGIEIRMSDPSTTQSMVEFMVKLFPEIEKGQWKSSPQQSFRDDSHVSIRRA